MVPGNMPREIDDRAIRTILMALGRAHGVERFVDGSAALEPQPLLSSMLL